LKAAVILYGLTPNEFWNLSWYEFSLYQLKYQFANREAIALQEVEWSRWRILYTQIANAMRKKGTAPFKPEQLIPLSFDKKPSIAPEVSREEIVKAAKRRLGSKFNFNGSNEHTSKNGGSHIRQRSAVSGRAAKE